jgi:hypothetical protein
MALQFDYTSKVAATYTGTAISGIGTPTFPVAATDTFTMTSGTSTGQADRMYAFSNTLSASGTTDLDLVATATDNLGTALGFARLKYLRVVAASTNTNNVVVSRPASNGVTLFSAASDAISVLPGGCFVWCAPGAGITVTASTADLITFTNSSSGSTVTYSVIVVGTSA